MNTMTGWMSALNFISIAQFWGWDYLDTDSDEDPGDLSALTRHVDTEAGRQPHWNINTRIDEEVLA